MPHQKQTLIVHRLEDRLTPTGSLFDALVAWYDAEGSAADRVGSHAGQLLHGAAFGTGWVGQAFQLDGIDDQIEIPNSPDLDRTDAASYEVWVNADRLPTATNNMSVMGFGFIPLDLDLRADGHLQFTVIDRHISSTSVVRPGVWYHVAATYTAGDRLALYVNGNREAELPITGGPRRPSDNPLVIGDNAGFPGRPFAGRIDEPAVYNRALTTAEVRAIYDAGNAGKESLRPRETFTQMLPVSPAPVLEGGPLTVSATVSADRTTPTGQVDFIAQPTNSPSTLIPFGSAQLVDGVATINLPRTSLAPGAYTVTAYYAGDTGHTTSESPAMGWTIVRASSQATTTTVTGLSPSSVRAGVSQGVVVGVSVTAATGTPAGEVAVFVGSREVGRGTLGTNGRAGVVATINLPAGTYPVTARYLGATGFSPSIAADTPDLNVGLSITSTRITGLSPSTVQAGQPTVVGVAVTATDGGTATGEVVVLLGSREIGRGWLGSGGRTGLVVTIPANLPAGTYPVTARYLGVGGLAPSVATDTPDLVVTAIPTPPPRVTLPPPAGSSSANPTQVVWLNFDGGKVSNIPDAASTLDLPAFKAEDLDYAASERPAVIAALLAEVQALYAGYNILISTTKPATGPYTRISIGGTNQATVTLSKASGGSTTTYRAPLGVSGVTFGQSEETDLGNTRLNDEAVVFSGEFLPTYGPKSTFSPKESQDPLRKRLAVTIAHELGHSLGLRHIQQILTDAAGNPVLDASGSNIPNPSVMAHRSPRPRDSTFQDKTFQLSDRDSRGALFAWKDGATTDNSAATLRTNLSGRGTGGGSTGGGRTSLDTGLPFLLDLGGLPAGLFDVVVEIGIPRSLANSTGWEFDSDYTGADTVGYTIVRQYVLAPGQTRLAINLPPGVSQPFAAVRGAAVPGGPIDVFTGIGPDQDGGFIPLFDAAGAPVPLRLNIRTDSGDVPFGNVAVSERNGFAQRLPGDMGVATTRYAVGAGPGGQPLISLFDARTNRPDRSYLAFEESFTHGVSVAQADANADGVPEVIVAAGPGGTPRVRVFDGQTDRMLSGPLGDFLAFEESFTGGVNVAAGDVNGDGFLDLVVGAGAGGGPRVRVFSGATGEVMLDFFAYEASFAGGVNVAAGDLDGDGKAELVIGSGLGGGPRVRVLRASDLSAMQDFFAYEENFRGGVNVAVGDLDGDGTLDLIAGSGVGGGPRVRTFDGGTGDGRTDQFVFEPEARVGVRVASVTPSDDPATQPVLVVAPGLGGGPRVRLIDPTTGDVRADDFVFDSEFTGGVFVG